MAIFFACLGTVVMSLVINVFENISGISFKEQRDTFPLLGAAIIGFIGYILFTRRRHKREEQQINYRRRMLEQRKISRYKIVAKSDEDDKPARRIEAVDENGNGSIINELVQPSEVSGEEKKKYFTAPGDS
jgi:hypothetical protein